jgi:two-component system sensor histidine kinase RegB
MTDEVLARAGEPFFTTKEPGRGMGLGLFLTRSVIVRLGGRFHLSSSPGEGATAVVELPRIRSAAK